MNRDGVLNELLPLFIAAAEGSISEADAEHLRSRLRDSEEARVAYCDYMTLEVQLDLEHSTVVEPSADEKLDRRRVVRSNPARSWNSWAVLAIAICLAIVLFVWRPWADPPHIARVGRGPEVALLPPENGESRSRSLPSVIVGNWRITPTGDANFETHESNAGNQNSGIQNPGIQNIVQLSRGELLVESVSFQPQKESPKQEESRELARKELRIETPQGDVIANGTRFYVGTHVPDPSGEEVMLKPFTRVLVLSGLVTLTNAVGTIQGGAGDLLAAEKDDVPVKLAVAANSDFGIDLYHELAKDKDNVGKNMFFSPYSITSALAMTAEGARGNTAREMGKALRYPEAAQRFGDDAQQIPWQMSLIHSGIAGLDAKLNGGEGDPKVVEATRTRLVELRKQLKELKDETTRLQRSGKWDEAGKTWRKQRPIVAEINKLAQTVDLYEISVANALWGDTKYPFRKTYFDTINQSYNTGGLIPTEFRTNPEAARAKINGWVEGQTNDRIKDLLPKDSITELTRLVLTNAIYFKGEWSSPFEESTTKEKDFTLADGSKVKRPLMQAHHVDVARYAAFNADGSPTPLPKNGWAKAKLPADGFAAVELPYKGDDLSMVVIAPNSAAGLPALEQQLSTAKLDRWIGALEQRDTHVYLPKFKVETEYKLTKTLPKMGMEDAFKPFGGADFTGMYDPTGLSPEDLLFISDVFHKAFVEVNEKGTEAAAATAVVMGVDESAGPPPPYIPTFNADRPFIYLIREKSTGCVLFLGRMMDPAEKTE